MQGRLPETHRLGIAGLVVAALVLSGCSGEDASSENSTAKAEYLAAAQAASECVRQQGFDVGEPKEDYAGLYFLQLSASSDEAMEKAIQVREDCWSEKVAPVEDQYIKEMGFSGAEWEANYRDLISCLEAAGVDGVKVGDDEGTVGEAVGDNPEGIVCLQGHLFALFQGGAGK